ncbi:hypothetical protein Hanom_Chr12g01142621 [Helianthus anomalus]
MKGVDVQITSQLISTTFTLNDETSTIPSQKTEVQNEFIKKGYDAQMVGATIFKSNFPPEMKSFFHILLICLSTKTTSFNELPLKTQYLGICYFENANYQLSQTPFLDMVGNVKARKRGTTKIFLMYPRL